MPVSPQSKVKVTAAAPVAMGIERCHGDMHYVLQPAGHADAVSVILPGRCRGQPLRLPGKPLSLTYGDCSR